MRKIKWLLPLILVGLSACLHRSGEWKGTIPEFRSYSREELLQDFNQFRGRVEWSHPMLWADETDVAALFDMQEKKIRNGMEEVEFLRLLAPIAAELRCGHTFVWPSEDFSRYVRDEVGMFPGEVVVIGGRLHLTDDLGPIPAGSEIVAMNGMSAGEILNRLEANVTADGTNLTRKHFLASIMFGILYAYFIDLPDFFEVEYREDAGGNPSTAVVSPQTGAELPWGNAVDPWSVEYSDGFALLWFDSFAFYENPEHNQFKAFVDNTFAEIRSRGIETLILDLRSGGGDPYLTAYLYRYLIHDPQPYFSSRIQGGYNDLKEPLVPAGNAFDGEVIALIDGRSFSSTAHLTALLKYHDLAVFVGEESGGASVCMDSSVSTTLRNTQIVFRYSTRVWEVAAQGLDGGRGIMPDVEVTAGIDDVLAGRDAVFEAARRLATGRLP